MGTHKKEDVLAVSCDDGKMYCVKCFEKDGDFKDVKEENLIFKIDDDEIAYCDDCGELIK